MNETHRKLRALAALRGSHFFNPGPMRYFKSRVLSPLYETDDGFIFITSEKPPIGPRAYSVRYMPHNGPDDISGGVVTIAYVRSRGIALRWAAKEYAVVMAQGGATDYSHREL